MIKQLEEYLFLSLGIRYKVTMIPSTTKRLWPEYWRTVPYGKEGYVISGSHKVSDTIKAIKENNCYWEGLTLSVGNKISQIKFTL